MHEVVRASFRVGVDGQIGQSAASYSGPGPLRQLEDGSSVAELVRTSHWMPAADLSLAGPLVSCPYPLRTIMNDLSFYRSVARHDWRLRRAQMEASRQRHTRAGVFAKSRLMRLTGLVEPAVAALGLRSRALANALALELREIDVTIGGLPQAFDGYRILQLSDIHVGRVPGLIEAATAIVGGLDVDLAVLTGDVQTRGHPSAAAATMEIAPLLAAVRANDGIVGVLGNHDRHDLPDHLEQRGVRMLINETLTLQRDGAQIRFTGVDDVNNFYSDDAVRALRAPLEERPPVSIALVHSPELADVASDAGYALYLAGHTHGGQICLPGGKALLTATEYHRKFAAGLWRYGRMLGYTSRGIGVGRRVRFNCPPEVTVLRLRRG
ncbi:MAG: metallophosphoesterase [Alphaproteobacteria bacterium]|nr:metallophosphoesterase [Alphaproteobacteria bacterium]